jgi:hypothetical protein
MGSARNAPRISGVSGVAMSQQMIEAYKRSTYGFGINRCQHAFSTDSGPIWGVAGAAEYPGASNARNLTAAGERSLARGCPYDM